MTDVDRGFLGLPHPAVSEIGVGSEFRESWSQFSGLLYRELVKTYRNPWIIAITVIQPFMWLAFFGSSFAGAGCAIVLPLTDFVTCNYIQFLLGGVLATSMLTIGMFGSMSMIQDKRFGYLKRVLITPTRRSSVFLAKSVGATTRGLIQFPVMMAAAFAFGVRFSISPIEWLGWVAALFCLGLGFSSLYLTMTARSTDWQTPGVVSNLITMPLMFTSTALFPSVNFPWWMQDISTVNPVTYAALFGRNLSLFGVAHWEYLGLLVVFAVTMVAIGVLVYSRWLRVE